MEVSDELVRKLKYLGIIPDEGDSVRNHNVGESDYSLHTIQPWSIWIDYNLDAFDADIVKRILRTKETENKNYRDSKIEDYEKIIHVCQEKIRQLKSLPFDVISDVEFEN